MKNFIYAQSRRLLWHINRSPLKFAIKQFLRLKNAKVVAKRCQLAAELSADSRLDALAENFQRDGYVLLNDVIDPHSLATLDRAGKAKLDRADIAAQQQTMNHKKFWTRLLDEDMENGILPTDNPFVSFALQPAVVGVLGRALGELPQLDYVLLTLSTDTGTQLAYSQLWHRDYDDVRTIKMFVYLTDVLDQKDGPFTFLPGPVSDRFGFALRSHREDAVILERVDASEVKAMIAPKLTTFLVETSRCMHMGSRLSAGHSRLLYTATFITVPRLYPAPAPRFRFTGSEDKISRYVLSPTGQEGTC